MTEPVLPVRKRILVISGLIFFLFFCLFIIVSIHRNIVRKQSFFHLEFFLYKSDSTFSRFFMILVELNLMELHNSEIIPPGIIIISLHMYFLLQNCKGENNKQFFSPLISHTCDVLNWNVYKDADTG